jgi:hypothetical protein
MLFTYSFGLIAQVNVSNAPPQTNPKVTYAKLHYDSVRKVMYQYKFPKWFFQGVVVSDNIPSDSVYTVAGQTIIISYNDFGCRWFKGSTQTYFDWSGNSWISQRSYNVDSLLTSNNTWTGKNTFKDSLIAEGGIKSKGVNTEGASGKAALALKGVQSDRDTVVNQNYTIDGSYGIIGFDCTTGQLNGSMLNDAQTFDWKFIIKKEDDSPNFLVLKNAQGIPFYTIKSRMTIIIKNKNGVWKRIQ